jgi:hypothetical protein
MEEVEAAKLRESALSGATDHKTPQKNSNAKVIRFADQSKATNMTASLVKKGAVTIQDKRTKAILSDEHEQT